ncbi:uncharacterized protein [Lepisosteus oculatus]|uniref:uncharacterized protein n=1 Tax=Lepisosteus oculatus TaxID=7918 RepID=UPI0035F5095B
MSSWDNYMHAVGYIFKGLSEKPEVEVHLKHYYIGDDISIRCGAKRGIRCHFYMDGSAVPFRSVPYREQYGQCHLSLSVEELVEDRDFGDSTEVSLSCSVEFKMDGQLKSSQRSKAEKVTVFDTFSKYGRPHIQVDHKVIKDERSVQVLCHSETGIRCFFYSGQAKQPFSSIIYSKESKTCQLTVPEKTLLTRTEDRMSPEILFSCSVELNLEDRAVTSRRSKNIKVDINWNSAGFNVTEEPLSATLFLTDADLVTSDKHLGVYTSGSKHYIGIATGLLLFVLAAVILTSLFFIHERNQHHRGRDQQCENNLEPCIYANVNEDNQLTVMQQQQQDYHTDFEVCYATVKRTERPKEKTPVVCFSQTDEYANVMMPRGSN